MWLELPRGNINSFDAQNRQVVCYSECKRYFNRENIFKILSKNKPSHKKRQKKLSHFQNDDKIIFRFFKNQENLSHI